MKIIGISGKLYFNKDNQAIMQTHERIRKTFMKYDDITCLTILPTECVDYDALEEGVDEINTEKMDAVLDKCDAFVIPGGSYCFKYDEYIINYAIKNDKPLLAICAGFQSFCSLFAKDRTKFDMCETKKLPNHVGTDAHQYKHKVVVKDNTLLKSIVGKNEMNVNSVHNDVVDFELKDAIINAYADDGIVEGAEYPNKKFILALQWHPEILLDEDSNKILDEFINRIR